MKWRVREIALGTFIVERKGGLWWVAAVCNYLWFDQFPRRFSDEGSAIEAMRTAISEWQFRPRVVSTEDGSQSGGEPREDGSISRRATTNSPTIPIPPGGKP